MYYMSKMCILCLSRDDLIKVDDAMYEDYLYFFPEINIHASQIPLHICCSCEVALEAFYIFRKKCLKSFKLWKSYHKELLDNTNTKIFGNVGIDVRFKRKRIHRKRISSKVNHKNVEVCEPNEKKRRISNEKTEVVEEISEIINKVVEKSEVQEKQVCANTNSEIPQVNNEECIIIHDEIISEEIITDTSDQIDEQYEPEIQNLAIADNNSENIVQCNVEESANSESGIHEEIITDIRDQIDEQYEPEIQNLAIADNNSENIVQCNVEESANSESGIHEEIITDIRDQIDEQYEPEIQNLAIADNNSENIVQCNVEESANSESGIHEEIITDIRDQIDEQYKPEIQNLAITNSESGIDKIDDQYEPKVQKLAIAHKNFANILKNIVEQSANSESALDDTQNMSENDLKIKEYKEVCYWYRYLPKRPPKITFVSKKVVPNILCAPKTQQTTKNRIEIESVENLPPEKRYQINQPTIQIIKPKIQQSTTQNIQSECVQNPTIGTIQMNVPQNQLPSQNSVENISNHLQPIVQLIKCQICGTYIKNIFNFQLHFRSHFKFVVEKYNKNQSTIIKCPFCRCVVSDLKALEGHFNNHNKIAFNNYQLLKQCDPFVFRKSVETLSVEDEQTKKFLIDNCLPSSNTRFYCKICGEYVQKKPGDGNNINKHIEKHLGNNADCCPLCDLQIYSDLLKIHMATVHMGAQGPYVCLRCDKYFTRLSALQMHIYLHFPTEIFGCKLCHYSAKDIQTVKVHILDHLKANNTLIPQSLSSDLKCKFNHNNFVQNGLILEKVETDEINVQKFTCTICGLKCTNRNQLNYHYEIHKAFKELKCELCNLIFFDTNIFHIHMQIHNSDFSQINTKGYVAKIVENETPKSIDKDYLSILKQISE